MNKSKHLKSFKQAASDNRMELWYNRREHLWVLQDEVTTESEYFSSGNLYSISLEQFNRLFIQPLLESRAETI